MAEQNYWNKDQLNALQRACEKIMFTPFDPQSSRRDIDEIRRLALPFDDQIGLYVDGMMESLSKRERFKRENDKQRSWHNCTREIVQIRESAIRMFLIADKS
jgi:hypothetical protein